MQITAFASRLYLLQACYSSNSHFSVQRVFLSSLLCFIWLLNICIHALHENGVFPSAKLNSVGFSKSCPKLCIFRRPNLANKIYFIFRPGVEPTKFILFFVGQVGSRRKLPFLPSAGGLGWHNLSVLAPQACPPPPPTALISVSPTQPSGVTSWPTTCRLCHHLPTARLPRRTRRLGCPSLAPSPPLGWASHLCTSPPPRRPRRPSLDPPHPLDRTRSHLHRPASMPTPVLPLSRPHCLTTTLNFHQLPWLTKVNPVPLISVNPG
jgi:hypothetical protein